MTANVHWHENLGLAGRRAPEWVCDPAELDALSSPLPGAHLLRRAWEAMDLDAALCVDGAPVAYFKRVHGLDPDSLAPLHRAAWNQGVAPVLVVVGDTQVRVYSTFAAPHADAAALDESHLVRALDRVADVLELASLGDSLVSGTFFDRNRNAFEPGARVDRFLVANLVAAGDHLTRGQPAHRRMAHLLLAQVLFTCYLVDRGVIGGPWLEKEGISGARTLRHVLERPDDEALDGLRRLFGGLHRDFNGDVFGVETVALLDAERLQVLRDLLRGDALATGQRSLGFWPYDFKVIPIETLSAVYEEFLEAEDPGGRKESGAFYTPRTLAELALDAGLGGKALLGKRYLDPACGSGVFLVAIFHRLVEAWRRENGGVVARDRAFALRSLLCDHVFGVDRSETACRITALGLYLAWLDHLDPRDVQTLLADGAMLPPLVQLGRADDGRNLFPRDFFAEDVLVGQRFDVVVGNPPWGGAAQGSLAVSWCAQRRLPLPRRQLACAFTWKVAEHLSAGGRAILLLPASVVFGREGPALSFVRRWLTTWTLERVVNLADLGEFLFDGSRAPTVCAVMRPTAPGNDARVELLAPLVTPEVQATDRLAWGPDDVRVVLQKRLMPPESEERASTEWKIAMRSSPRDRRLLDRLFDLPALGVRLDDGPEGGAWVLREGFNEHGSGKWVPRPLLVELPLVDQSAAYVVTPNPKSRTSASGSRRWPDEAVFRAPQVLFPHGVPRTGERIRAGFCAQDCVFTHSIRGLHAPSEDEDLLRFLACTLASPLALYVFFHTSTSFGVWRAKVLVDEYRRFPFPPPDDDQRRTALAEAVRLHRALAHLLSAPLTSNDAVAQLEAAIDEQVYRYYDLDEDERTLVHWTTEVVLPSATPSRSTWPVPALLAPSFTERAAYCDRLGRTLTAWTRDGWIFDAQSIIGEAAGLGVVILERRRPTAARTPVGATTDLGTVLARLRGLLTVQRSGDVVERGLKVFDGERLYLVKPLRRRHWGEAVALSDADEIAGALLTRSWKSS